MAQLGKRPPWAQPCHSSAHSMLLPRLGTAHWPQSRASRNGSNRSISPLPLHSPLHSQRINAEGSEQAQCTQAVVKEPVQRAGKHKHTSTFGPREKGHPAGVLKREVPEACDEGSAWLTLSSACYRYCPDIGHDPQYKCPGAQLGPYI